MPRDFQGSFATAEDIVGLTNNEAEQALLGTILCQNLAYHSVVEALRSADFASPVHGRIFDAISVLIDRGHVANPITLKNVFDQDGSLISIGGAQYLAKLAESAPTLLNAESYASTIKDLATRRSIVVACDEAKADALRVRADRLPSEILEDFDRRILEIDGGQETNAPKSLEKALQGALEIADRTFQFDGRIPGITTGLRDLDRTLGGLQEPDLIIVAGCTAMGKTALAIRFALAAAQAGYRVLFFTLEMGAEQLAQRILAAQTGISVARQRTGPISQADIDDLVAAQAKLSSPPLTIDDTAGVSVGRVRARSLQHKRRFGLDLIVVDYLQLLQSDRTRLENRVQEVSQISLALKHLAKELRTPVVALSQLSRAVEQREDKRPHLADLRDSGSIEQDADIVLFVYRDEYYLARDEPRQRQSENDAAFVERLADWSNRLSKVCGRADIIIAKNRHGAANEVVATAFNAERTSFENLAWGATQ